MVPGSCPPGVAVTPHFVEQRSAAPTPTEGRPPGAIDGPGQYESPLLDAYVSMQNWIDAVLVDWLLRRVGIDPDKIGVTGTSFGSFFGTVLTANEPRIAATAVISTCLEPGCRTIFEEPSPTFKKRLMWMSNYDDEAKFDECVKTLTREGHAVAQ
jgi:dienelactone hydrolase